MALVHKQTQKQGSVGQSYGERREIRRSEQAQVKSHKAQVAPKPLDKFAGVSQGKNKQSLAGFAPNATFNQARRFSTSTPYKRPLHDHIEKGSAPVGNAKPPSDRAILKFLDRVIESTPDRSRVARGAVTKKAQTAGQPVIRSQRQPLANPKSKVDKA